jgi:competence protein ComEA
MQRIRAYILPRVLILAAAFAPSAAGQASDARINLNTATIGQLMQLPGIGQTFAARIVEHRGRHGMFKRPQDVIIVRGMSAKRYRRIAHLLRI